VSFKKGNNKLLLADWSSGSGNLGQTSLNLYSHLICHPQTSSNPNPAVFLNEVASLTESFEAFHNSIAQPLASYGLKNMLEKIFAPKFWRTRDSRIGNNVKQYLMFKYNEAESSQWLQGIYWHWIFLLYVWIDVRLQFVTTSFVEPFTLEICVIST